MKSFLLVSAAPCALSVGILAALCSPALAQTQSPSQVPPGQTLDRRAPVGTFRLPAAQGLTAPEGAEAIRFRVRDLRVEGGLAPLQSRTEALKPTAGSEISVAEVYDFAAALQAIYLEAGYPLVRVVVPAQDLEPESGVVRVLVVSGFVERVDVDSLPRSVQGRVEAVLSPLVGREPLGAAEFERRLLLAGETAGVALESALSPGTRTGGTVLVVGGQHRPLQLALALDNGLSDELGREQATLSVAANSLLGLGERIILTAALSPDDLSWSEDTLRRYASVYAEVPLGQNGFSIGGEAAYSSSAPQGASAPLALFSEYTNVGAFVSLATVRTRARSQSVRLTFDAAEEEQSTGILGFPVALFVDRTRVARLAVDGSEPIFLDGQLDYDLEISQGIDGLGARSIDDATPLRPLSRLGADAEFTRLQAGISALMPLGSGFSAQALLRGQTGFDEPLLRSEQGNIASSDLISGPPAGSLVGDDTAAGRIELRRSLRADRAVVLPYVFGAAGRTWLKAPLVGERERTDSAALGVGVRFDARLGADTSVFGRLEWSHVESEQAFADRAWTSFSLTLRY